MKNMYIWKNPGKGAATGERKNNYVLSHPIFEDSSIEHCNIKMGNIWAKFWKDEEVEEGLPDITEEMEDVI